MKRFLAFLLCLTAFLLLDSCKKEPYLSVSPESLSFPQAGGSRTVTISANYPWTASASGSGFSVSPDSGVGDATVTVTASPASSSDMATGSLSIRSEGLSASVKLEQDAKTTVVVGNVSEVPAEGGIVTVDIQFNADYEVGIESSAKSWITFNGTKALSSGKLEFKVAANEETEARSGKVTVQDKLHNASPVTFTITQEANKMLARTREILMEFYNKMNGPNWTNHSGWGTDKPLESWSHIEYTKGVGVTKISFMYDHNLKGTIPSCIGELTSLNHFTIWDAPDVTGSLPDSFGNLVNLESFNIIQTSITSIPDVFGGLDKLKNVTIVGNEKLTGPLPVSIGNSSVLETLHLNSNLFTGDIPASWARLGTNLSVGDNCLSGVVPEAILAIGDDAWLIDDVLYQKDGYGFDISNVELHGAKFWLEGEVQDLDGNPFSFKDVVAKNKYTVYLFWATWCPFSKVLMPQLKEYYAQYHKSGLEIIATIAAGDSDGNLPTKESQKKEVVEKGYDKWLNFFFFQIDQSSYPMLVPVAEVYDSEGNILFSGFAKLNDPVRNRFDRTASSELIPFLESLLGPADVSDVYTSKDFSKDGEVLTLQKASAGKGINIVFLGDAYTDKDMAAGGLYETVMKESMEEFFAVEPYKTFRNRFNVYAVKAVSTNDRIGEGCSTALSCYYGSGTAILGNDDACYSYALKVPGITDQNNLLVCVMVNSSVSKGTTSMSYLRQSSVAYTTTIDNAREFYGSTLRHEAGGHGFAFLADEYSSYYESAPADHVEYYNSMYNQYGWFSNVDFTNDPAKIRWSAFLDDDRYKDTVGIFEGGALYMKGVWRPTKNSVMNEEIGGFNAPSRWAIYQRIMKLSGEDYSFAKFLEYDAVNRGSTKSGVPVPLKRPEGWEPGAPPVIVP